jgi:hypothetical protein
MQTCASRILAQRVCVGRLGVSYEQAALEQRHFGRNCPAGNYPRYGQRQLRFDKTESARKNKNVYITEKQMKRYFLIIVALLLSFTACSAPKQSSELQESEYIAFEVAFNRQSGYATNQFAVWIETADGEFVKTIAVTKFTANGGYTNRSDALKLWRERGGLDNVDAVTVATPKGEATYRWTFDDYSGNRVVNGDYVYFVEGNLRWGNRVIYSGTIIVGESVICGVAERELVLEASDGNPALANDAPEIDMISNVTARYVGS